MARPEQTYQTLRNDMRSAAVHAVGFYTVSVLGCIAIQRSQGSLSDLQDDLQTMVIVGGIGSLVAQFGVLACMQMIRLRKQLDELTREIEMHLQGRD